MALSRTIEWNDLGDLAGSYEDNRRNELINILPFRGLGSRPPVAGGDWLGLGKPASELFASNWI